MSDNPNLISDATHEPIEKPTYDDRDVYVHIQLRYLAVLLQDTDPDYIALLIRARKWAMRKEAIQTSPIYMPISQQGRSPSSGTKLCHVRLAQT